MEASMVDPEAMECARQLDRERLQGAWTYFAGRRQAQMLITGDHFTFKFDNGDIYVGTFVLHPTKRPKVMEMRISEGPERYRGKTALAIYQLDDNKLIWCACPPGTEKPLRAFPPEDDRDHLCIIFRQEKPQRRTRIDLSTT